MRNYRAHPDYPNAPSPVTITNADGLVIARVQTGTRDRIDAKTREHSVMVPPPVRRSVQIEPAIKRALSSLVPIRRKTRGD